MKNIQKLLYPSMLAALVSSAGLAQQAPAAMPADAVYQEAESFKQQTSDGVRKWQVKDTRSDDPAVVAIARQAGGGTYLHCLPDTRTTHDDKLTNGINFSNKPGEMAVLSYKVQFKKPGRYYLWVKAYSTGSEDNGVHAGLNGTWPESGQRLQWCEGKNKWTWSNRQRTQEVHCGVPYLIYLDVPTAGEHEVLFSMREDGFRMDSFLLTLDKEYVPN
ncbi:hypothetical protein [Telluribacter sp.]|jgi:hypothetical protein|uniref:hypothetical protein n=1 Tax=Telluribacter sp. TaxID=1978767 RepID=UPI002E120830|nr:hypothetical protein [Telluribacter sp.]